MISQKAIGLQKTEDNDDDDDDARLSELVCAVLYSTITGFG